MDTENFSMGGGSDGYLSSPGVGCVGWFEEIFGNFIMLFLKICILQGGGGLDPPDIP